MTVRGIMREREREREREKERERKREREGEEGCSACPRQVREK